MFCATFRHLQDLFWTNCLVQLCIFLPFVQLPVALTGHMTYVDIGWPSGLVAIGVIALVCGTGATWLLAYAGMSYRDHFEWFSLWFPL